MTRSILNPSMEQLNSVRFAAVSKYSHGKTLSSYDNNGVMALSIYSSNGYADKKTGVVSNMCFLSCSNVSIVYMWNLAVEDIDGNITVFIGRDLKSLDKTLKTLSVSFAYQAITHNTINESSFYDVLEQIKNGKMPYSFVNRIYVHGLQLAFQSLRNLYNSEFSHTKEYKYGIRCATFARTPRNPMTATVSNLVGTCELRFLDSNVLIKKSLKEWMDDENIPLDVEDMENTNTIITPDTPLTEEFMEIGSNHVSAIVFGIQKLRKDGLLSNLPVTQTGFTRRKLIQDVCKKEPFSSEETHKKSEKPCGSVWSRNAANINKSMSPEEYARMRQIFTGGFVFVNRRYQCLKIHNVVGMDFSSAYLFVLSHMLFPVSKFEPVKKNVAKIYLNRNDILNFNRKTMWYAHLKIENLKMNDNRTIPFWQCYKCVEENSKITNKLNGKIRSASTLDFYITDVDFDTFKKVYCWDKITIIDMWEAKAGLLPESLILDVLEAYKNKTYHKGDKSKYSEAKANASSIYGISVTRIFDDTVILTSEGWDSVSLNEDLFNKKKASMNASNTILPYQVGVWVTAWGRFNICRFIIGMENKRVYGDTDSIFGWFDDSDYALISEYENWMNERRVNISKVYPAISPDMYTAYDKKGNLHNMGAFDIDNTYIDFKVLGAKRYAGSYLDEETNTVEMKVAISGVPKKAATNKIKHVDDLIEDLYFSPEESLLKTPVFVDDMPNTIWKDPVTGKTTRSKQKFGTFMAKTPFTISVRSNVNEMFKLLEMDTWCNNGTIDVSDPVFIRESLDK